ncbi:MAG: NAD(P)/FAD-dependent oxidoreductase, partial [Candidatus Methylomirabilales bacterium]
MREYPMGSSRPRIVVVGGSFAGLTAVLELKRLLKEQAEITLLSKQNRFVFIPSLIWVPFGWREPGDISFDLRPTLERRGISFIHAAVERIEPEHSQVILQDREIPYDYLVIATGPSLEFEAVPGLGPHGGYTQSVCTLDHALEARKAWVEFLKDPGPVIVGATQGASCFGAAYEFVFNLEYALRKAKVRDKAPVTFVTAEPFLAHFGIGGMGKGREMTEWFFRRLKIDGITNAVVEKVTPGMVHLANGRTLPFKYAMIIPPFQGVEAIRNSPGIGDARGFVPVTDTYRHPTYPNIYAAGVAVAVRSPQPTPVPTGVPKTGYVSEVMAKVAAQNIAAAIKGG